MDYGPADASPSSYSEHPFLLARLDKFAYDSADGKWLMFFPRSIISQRWATAVELYFNGALHGISCLKVSTVSSETRTSGSLDHVIMFYCGPSRDEDTVMQIGRRLISSFSPDTGAIYYKSNEQSRSNLEDAIPADKQGQARPKKQKNSLYKLSCQLARNNDANLDSRGGQHGQNLVGSVKTPLPRRDYVVSNGSHASWSREDLAQSSETDDEPGRKKVMVLDTETTGFPPKAPPSDLVAWKFCRMLEIAWHVYEEDGRLIEKQQYIVKPDFSFDIPAGSIRVHGITREKAEKEGYPLDSVLDSFSSSLQCVSAVVGHNVQFDVKVILAEISRQNRDELFARFRRIPKLCTMEMGKSVMPGGKIAKLASLFENCFGISPSGILHRADADVEACARIYFFLREIDERDSGGKTVTKGVNGGDNQKESVKHSQKNIGLGPPPCCNDKAGTNVLFLGALVVLLAAAAIGFGRQYFLF